MIAIISGINRSRHNDLVEQMYMLRARQFHDRRGWSVLVHDRKEYDVYDDLDPVYVCVLDQSGAVVGSLRLLPTNGPHMVTDVFRETMGDRAPLRDHRIVECSRFCVDTTRAKRQAGGVNRVTKKLLHGLFTYTQNAKYASIVAVHDLFMERILRRAGCSPVRLGPVVKYDGLSTVCSLFEVSNEVIASVSFGLDELPKSYALSA